ncbi:unnamed protein product [Rotaria sp. Silwood2]|nr:unnamed protein product [Rotaria sp. Silwood2]
MQHFLEVAFDGSYRGPCTKTVRSTMKQMYLTYREDLRKVMSKINHVALTADMWSNSRRQSFICVTAHIMTNTYENIPVLIGFRRFKGRHTGESIRNYIDYELKRSGIESHRIISITTDGASNFESAMGTFQFGYHFKCASHNLNLVVSKGVCLWKRPNPNTFPFTNDENFNDNDVQFDSEEEISDTYSDSEEEQDDVSNDQVTPSTSPSENSSSTTIISEDEFSSDEELDDEECDTGDIEGGVLDEKVFHILLNNLQVLQKTRKLIAFIRNHQVTRDYVNQRKPGQVPYGNIILDMKIRWNSTQIMLERFLNHRNVIQAIVASPDRFKNSLTKKCQTKLKKLSFTHDEWDLLQIISSVLGPFHLATEMLSGQTYPTLSTAYYTIKGLQTFLWKEDDELELARDIKRSLQAQFKYYFNVNRSIEQKQLTLAAAFLDPTMYKEMSENDIIDAKKIIMKLMREKANIVSMSMPVQQSKTTTNQTSKEGAKEKFAKLCGISTTTTTSSTYDRRLSLDEELCYYVQAIADAKQFNTFWIENDSKLPNLANIVRQICAIPATSISSETAFSLSGYLCRKQRTSLGSKSIRHSMILKYRPWLDKLIQHMDPKNN